MTDSLDHILLSEKDIIPSPGFVGSVMEAVRRSRRYSGAIGFPWWRFFIGMFGGLSCTLLSAAVLLPRGIPDWPPLNTLKWATECGAGYCTEILCAIAVLATTLLAVRLATDVSAY